MKKIFKIILALLVSTAASANELENTLNKVYGKGSKVAEGYISNLLSGPGETEVSIENKYGKKPVGTIMIVRPYSISEDSVFFYQAQLNSHHVQGEARQSLNYGVGKRFLSDNKSHFWGINTFVDLDREKNSRLGFGTEFKATAFNVHGNYYLDVVGGGNQVDTNIERVLDGYDINISGQVPYAPWANINYNNYTWKAVKAPKDSEGEIYSAIIDVSNNITLEMGRDDNTITNHDNFVNVIYIPGSKKRPNWNDGYSSTAFPNSDVSKDMLQKITRSNIITLELESNGVVLINGN